jgi:hypothetical protein
MTTAIRRGSAGRAVFWAVALVVIGVLAYYVYTKKQGPQGPEGPGSSEFARYLCVAHEEGFSPAGVARMNAKTREAAYEAGKQWLGNDVTLQETVGKGLDFLGAGEAQVPGQGRSAQYLFLTDASSSQPGQRVSLFLQVDRRILDGLEPLEIGKAYSMKPTKELGAGAPDIVVCKKGGLVYYLVANTPAALAQLKGAYSIPDPSGKF